MASTVAMLAAKQREYFNQNRTRPEAVRRAALSSLLEGIDRHEEEIYEALSQDLGKSKYEAYLAEVQLVRQEIKTSLKHLHRWMKPKRVGSTAATFPSKGKVFREPFGVTLVLSPWNYPFQLAMVPLVGAIAGGNCVLLRPSHSSPHTAALLRRLVAEALPEELAACVPEEAEYDEILNEAYDLIFFTGSERVGKIVMEAASRHLTPVVLELGGKSPCMIDRTADLEVAARRVAWGKFLNAGQTCVAPDYLLVEETVREEFCRLLIRQVECLYTKNALEHPHYPRIINRHHFDRLTGYIAGWPDHSGGRSNPETLKIEPTLFYHASFEDPIMQEEIFGPILPVISFSDREEMIHAVKRRPRPLALYLFTRDRAFRDQVLDQIPFGGGCVNDTVIHLANHHLPFGGIGSSGMGQYHGAYSFEAFTHPKGVLLAKNRPDFPFRYPPYREETFRWTKRLTK